MPSFSFTLRVVIKKKIHPSKMKKGRRIIGPMRAWNGNLMLRGDRFANKTKGQKLNGL